MKLFFGTFRTITRNFGMVWPPVVTFAVFVLVGLLPVVALLTQVRMMAGSNQLFFGMLPDLATVARSAFGLQFFLFVIFAMIYFLLFLLLSVFMYGAMYNMVSGVLNGDRHYWSNFGRGGLRYFGWSILYGIISAVIGLLAQIIINFLFSGEPFPAQPSAGATVINTIFSVVIFYLFALFLPALIDGKERFMDAMGTSFRLAWRTFLVTILPFILFTVILILLILALVAIGALLHPIVSVLLGIPAVLYIVPFYPLWMTAVYRKLTDKPPLNDPQPPADENPRVPLPPAFPE